MADAEKDQPVNEWDEQGKPLQAGAQSATEWDEHGNPVSGMAPQTETQFEKQNKQTPFAREATEFGLGVASGASGLPETLHPVRDFLRSLKPHTELTKENLVPETGPGPAVRVAKTIISPEGLDEEERARNRAHAVGQALGVTVPFMVGEAVDRTPGMVTSGARSILTDPVTGRATLTPGSLVDRFLRSPEEAQAIRDARELAATRRNAALEKIRNPIPKGNPTPFGTQGITSSSAPGGTGLELPPAPNTEPTPFPRVKTRAELKAEAAAPKKSQQPSPFGPGAVSTLTPGGAALELPRPSETPQPRMGVVKTRAEIAAESKPKIVTPNEPVSITAPRESEGSAARFTNEDTLRLAKKGIRPAIVQARQRGFELPENVRYVMGDIDYPDITLNPREVTRFTPEGEPIRQGPAPQPESEIPNILGQKHYPPTASTGITAETPQLNFEQAIRVPSEEPLGIPAQPTPETVNEPLTTGYKPSEKAASMSEPRKIVPEQEAQNWQEEANRNRAILDDPRATEEDKRIAQSRIDEAEDVKKGITAEPEEEAEPAEAKGITEPIKPKTVKPKPQKIEDMYNRDQIADAEGLVQSEVDMMQSADQPGRVPIIEQRGGNVNPNFTEITGWRGVKSMRGMTEFFKDNPDITPEQARKALRNKDSAAYRKIIDRAMKTIRRIDAKRAQSREYGITGPPEEEEGSTDFPFGANAPEEPEGVLPGMGEHVRAQEEGAAQVRGEGLTAEMNTPRDISEKAFQMETKSPLFRGTEASPQKEMFMGGSERLPMTTDQNGTRWVSTPDGKFRVTIPRDVPDTEAEAYARPKLEEQKKGFEGLFR